MSSVQPQLSQLPDEASLPRHSVPKALFALGTGGFAIGTGEFVIMGLLPDAAKRPERHHS